ncbi:MAG: acyltransferase [Nitrospirae bacterium]|nr:acyltransferase [Nitrospirota bacterium]MBI4847283.1 acyltransferase [Nitrospirota bacterium]
MGLVRLILAISVLISHSAPFVKLKLVEGDVAVQIFYIISGFYMALILNEKYVGKNSYRLFLSNRFLRLYPIYWVVLCLTILFTILCAMVFDGPTTLTFKVKYFNMMSIGTKIFQILANIFLFGQDIMMFLGMNTEKGTMFFTHNYAMTSPQFHNNLFLNHTWTLGIELMFYVLAPFIVRRSYKAILLMIIVSLSIRAWIYFYLGWFYDPWTYRFFPAELSLFLMGTMSYKFYKLMQKNPFHNNVNKIITMLFFSLLCSYQFIPYIFHAEVKKWLFYLLACISIPFVFQLTNKWKFDRSIGELSYPIYIVHVLVIGSILPFINLFKWSNYTGEFAVSFSILAAYILNKFIADPIERKRQLIANQLS